MKEKKKIIGLVSAIVVLIIVIVGVSYAWLTMSVQGNEKQVLRVGGLRIILNETNSLTISDARPISDSEGMAQDGFIFSVENQGALAADYNVYLDDDAIETTQTRLDDQYVKYSLDVNDTTGTAKTLSNRLIYSGHIEKGATDNFVLRVWLNDEIDGYITNQVFKVKIRVEVNELLPSAVETLLAKANPEDLDYSTATTEQQKEMWTFSHPATEQTEALTDYRYIGVDPNNYVSFNNELWRIIGVFTVDDGTGKKEQRLKIIRNESIGTYSWDNKDTTTGAESNYGKNNWPDARLNYLLNPGHESESVGGSLYWNSSSGNCYRGSNNGTTSCDFTTTGLKEEARNMIGDTLWYLGGAANYTSAINGLTSHWYSYERGTNVYSGRSTSWIGKVGLMYPSDYGYATSGGATTNRNACLNKALYNWDSSSFSDCKNNDWLYNFDYQWTLTSRSSTSNDVFYVFNTGFVTDNLARNTRGARPVVFLKSNITIASGNGSSSQPYILQS